MHGLTAEEKARWRATQGRSEAAERLRLWIEANDIYQVGYPDFLDEALAAERRATVERIKDALPTSGKWGITEFYRILDEEAAR